MTDVMKIIREERKKQGISLQKVAYITQISTTTLWAYENYMHSPKFEIIESILNFLGYEIIIQRKE